MGIAIWCDIKDKGHAFDEREAIIVNANGDARYFCQAHCIPAFVTAFHMARIDGQADIFLPTLGGHFAIRPQDGQQAQNGQIGDGAQDTAIDGASPQTATAAKGEPSRGKRSRETAQAIADMLEQEPRSGSQESAATNYGARA
jgi:hypothetical protein